MIFVQKKQKKHTIQNCYDVCWMNYFIWVNKGSIIPPILTRRTNASMTEQTKKHDILHWKSSFWFGTCTKMCIYRLVSSWRPNYQDQILVDETIQNSKRHYFLNSLLKSRLYHLNDVNCSYASDCGRSVVQSVRIKPNTIKFFEVNNKLEVQYWSLFFFLFFLFFLHKVTLHDL